MHNEFDLDPSLIYVNHAAVAPWPQRTVRAVQQFAEENGRLGSRHYTQWLAKEQQLKQALAELIHAESADEIALLKNTSEGLSIIAQGIDWQPHDNIVISNQEFPSNFIVWDALRARGVELRIADISGHQPEQAMIELMDANTRLLSVSAVQYASGLKMDLPRLGLACLANNTLFCVDAIQQIGALQFDVQAIQADFVVADGHKWMLGPEGLALFYCKQSSMPQLSLQQHGWHMVQDLSDFSAMHNWQPAQNARRFECGSPNSLSIHALHASVSLLLETGMAQIEQQLLQHVRQLHTLFAGIPGVEILSPHQHARQSGIFTFSKQHTDLDALYRFLVDKGVVCALRGGGIRFSPHFYNRTYELEQLAQWVRAF